MAKQKLNREPLEDMIWEVLKEDRHPLEAFTDLDYWLAGASFGRPASAVSVLRSHSRVRRA